MNALSRIITATSCLLITSLGNVEAQSSNTPPESIVLECKKALREICTEINKIQPQYPELSSFRCPDQPETLSLHYWHKVEEVKGRNTKGKSDDHPEAQEGGCLLDIQFLGGLWQNYNGGPHLRSVAQPYSKTNMLIQAVMDSPNSELVSKLEKIVRSKIPRVDER
jgi:hypothetical protein